MVPPALCLTLLLTSCSPSEAPGGRDDPPELNRGTALVDTDGDSALFYVTVAETEEQRSAAFESTTSLDDDEGMAFLYFEPTTDAFEMQGSLPLSVAFFDEEGEVVDVADVAPCRGEECPTYDPEVPYLGTLSVNSGVFERLGVDEGADVEIVPGSE
jgi:uncharacterized membrane protein (UPF0127 family)